MTRIFLRRKLTLGLASIVLVMAFGLCFGNSICIYFENDEPSASIGTPENGELINGKRLPTRGSNFVAYSYLGSMLGRNSVNIRVRDAVIESYEAVHIKHPEKTFVYGETGWPHGGRFRPHKSHENGLSVDFMVPILDEDGGSVPLPTSVFNKFGYGIEFDKTGAYGKYRIDFDSMAEHIYELNQATKRNGLIIRRVIFAPELQPHLFNTEYGRLIKDRIKFSIRPSWVRHDEHYHVDFKPAS